MTKEEKRKEESVSSICHMLFHTGAFNAFDKDGDGIIKLNVLEVSATNTGVLCIEPSVLLTPRTGT